LAATPTVSRGVHDSRAEHWCIATKRPAALSCPPCDTVHTHSTAGTCTTGSGWVCALPKPPSSFTGRTSAAATCTTRDFPYTRCWCRRARARAREALPAVVLMRGGGRRCTWSVDAASGLSARCWRKQEMGWPGRLEGCYVGCGWEVVVVVYVGETVHVRDSQLQAPTHRPQDLGQMS
jgi:hypothetical protein